jgi:hypothetical protein
VACTAQELLPTRTPAQVRAHFKNLVGACWRVGVLLLLQLLLLLPPPLLLLRVVCVWPAGDTQARGFRLAWLCDASSWAGVVRAYRRTTRVLPVHACCRAQPQTAWNPLPC